MFGATLAIGPVVYHIVMIISKCSILHDKSLQEQKVGSPLSNHIFHRLRHKTHGTSVEAKPFYEAN